MSNEVKQETGDVVGDDRDFFEEDFKLMEPGSCTVLPEGCEADQALQTHLLNNGPKFFWRGLECIDVEIKAQHSALMYFGFVPMKQIDNEPIRDTIDGLLEHGLLVTLVDAQTGLQIDAGAYQNLLSRSSPAPRCRTKTPVRRLLPRTGRMQPSAA